MKVAIVAFVAAAALVALPAASAKDFRPGDLRICNSAHCKPVGGRRVLALLSAFIYDGRGPAQTGKAHLGQPYYQLRYTDGYVAGIVATRHLDRFLSYGVDLGRFARYQWYAVPGRASREFRGLTSGLRPLRLTRGAIAKSH